MEAQREVVVAMVQPVHPRNFGLARHKMTLHSMEVSGILSRADLEDNRLWQHIAAQIKVGDEVRVVSDDLSFRAECICVFALGSDVRMKVFEYSLLEAVEVLSQTPDYEVQLRGLKKWCVIKKSTGEIIRENLPAQSAAQKQLEDHLRVLGR